MALNEVSKKEKERKQMKNGLQKNKQQSEGELKLAFFCVCLSSSLFMLITFVSFHFSLNI